MRPAAAKLVAVLDDVTVEGEENNVAIVATENVVIALCYATPEGLELFEVLDGGRGNVDVFRRYLGCVVFDDIAGFGSI